MVVDIKDIPIQKAQQYVVEGESPEGLARKDQEKLLASFVGQGDMVNMHRAYPGNPVQGLWDSLHAASDDRNENDPLTYMWRRRQEIAIMDGRECCYPRMHVGVAVDPNLHLLANVDLSFISFENAGRQFVKIFGSYTHKGKTIRKSLLYEKAGMQPRGDISVPIWRRSKERDGNLNNPSQTRDEFFVTCFKKNVALHKVRVDEFHFRPDPKWKQPGTLSSRRVAA